MCLKQSWATGPNMDFVSLFYYITKLLLLQYGFVVASKQRSLFFFLLFPTEEFAKVGGVAGFLANVYGVT